MLLDRRMAEIIADAAHRIAHHQFAIQQQRAGRCARMQPQFLQHSDGRRAQFITRHLD